MAQALPKFDRTLLSVIARGAERIFENAEKPPTEAEILAYAGATAIRGNADLVAHPPVRNETHSRSSEEGPGVRLGGIAPSHQARRRIAAASVGRDVARRDGGTIIAVLGGCPILIPKRGRAATADPMAKSPPTSSNASEFENVKYPPALFDGYVAYQRNTI